MKFLLTIELDASETHQLTPLVEAIQSALKSDGALTVTPVISPDDATTDHLDRLSLIRTIWEHTTTTTTRKWLRLIAEHETITNTEVVDEMGFRARNATAGVASGLTRLQLRLVKQGKLPKPIKLFEQKWNGFENIYWMDAETRQFILTLSVE